MIRQVFSFLCCCTHVLSRDVWFHYLVKESDLLLLIMGESVYKDDVRASFFLCHDFGNK